MINQQRVATLREEQTNPTSYWSWLSHDMVDHYLVNQYSHLWMFNRPVETKVIPRLDPEVSRSAFCDILERKKRWIFYGSASDSQGKVSWIWQKNGSRFSHRWIRWRDFYYILTLAKLYVFTLSPVPVRVERTQRKKLLDIQVTSQGQLVELSTNPQGRLVLGNHALTISVEVNNRIFVVDHGLVYAFSQYDMILRLYCLTTGQLLRIIRLPRDNTLSCLTDIEVVNRSHVLISNARQSWDIRL